MWNKWNSHTLQIEVWIAATSLINSQALTKKAEDMYILWHNNALTLRTRNQGTGIRMFRSASMAIAKIFINTNGSRMDAYVKIIYYRAIKMNELYLQRTWINLKNIMSQAMYKRMNKRMNII